MGIAIFPATSNFCVGPVVPIPTFPVPFGLRRILPVVLYVAELPRVKSFRFVLDMLPLPSMKVAAGEVPEIEAVGVPVSTFLNANLALVVAVPPIKTSAIWLFG